MADDIADLTHRRSGVVNGQNAAAGAARTASRRRRAVSPSLEGTLATRSTEIRVASPARERSFGFEPDAIDAEKPT
jgi:hypothetical protein